jgi:hypothetical protein
MLRGGPSIKTPGSFNYWLNFGTDNRKKLQVYGNIGTNWGFDNSSKNSWYGIDLTYRPWDALRISFLPDYSVSNSELQYVDTEEFNNDDRYVFAEIDQITTDLTVRIDYTITPGLTIQYYGSPFITAVDYSDAKYITNPNAEKFEDRFSTDMSWSTEPDTDQNYKDYLDSNYDFNFKQFRSNLVLRWEYRSGSLLYLVWTQSKTGDENIGKFSLGNDLDELFNLHPSNVFLIKLSFRIAN